MEGIEKRKWCFLFLFPQISFAHFYPFPMNTFFILSWLICSFNSNLRSHNLKKKNICLPKYLFKKIYWTSFYFVILTAFPNIFNFLYLKNITLLFFKCFSIILIYWCQKTKKYILFLIIKILLQNYWIAQSNKLTYLMNVTVDTIRTQLS